MVLKELVLFILFGVVYLLLGLDVWVFVISELCLAGLFRFYICVIDLLLSCLFYWYVGFFVVGCYMITCFGCCNSGCFNF